jgi:hypothetical protein
MNLQPIVQVLGVGVNDGVAGNEESGVNQALGKDLVLDTILEEEVSKTVWLPKDGGSQGIHV